MYQLYGDPLLRLQYPHELQLACSSEAARGESLTVDGRSDVAGNCTIELVTDRGGPGNLSVVSAATQSVEAGPFRVFIPVPRDATGQYTIRGYIAGQFDFAMGATGVALRSTSVPTTSRATNGSVPR